MLLLLLHDPTRCHKSTVRLWVKPATDPKIENECNQIIDKYGPTYIIF